MKDFFDMFREDMWLKSLGEGLIWLDLNSRAILNPVCAPSTLLFTPLLVRHLEVPTSPSQVAFPLGI